MKAVVEWFPCASLIPTMSHCLPREHDSVAAELQGHRHHLPSEPAVYGKDVDVRELINRSQ